MGLAPVYSRTSRLKPNAMPAHDPRRMTRVSTAAVDLSRLVAVTRMTDRATICDYWRPQGDSNPVTAVKELQNLFRGQWWTEISF